MSKKITFRIFVMALATILISFVANFTIITNSIGQIFHEMQNPYLAIPAVCICLIIRKKRFAKLWLLFFAIMTAILIQMFLGSGAFALLPIMYKIMAFYVYVFLIILMRYMF